MQIICSAKFLAVIDPESVAEQKAVHRMASDNFAPLHGGDSSALREKIEYDSK
jgi:hypothetical protein